MLKSLHIENYALIRHLDIAFDEGFTVITGETGAGKSILLGAIALVLGNRADTSVLLDPSKKCIVEAEFDITFLPLESFFQTHDIDYQPLTIIRREINHAGKSRAFINDTPININGLKDLASSLIDIHSQHQHLWLQNADFRMSILDEFAQLSSLNKEYKAKYQSFKKLEKECEDLRATQRQLWTEKDYLQYLTDEFIQMNLQEDEQTKLEQTIVELSHAETIKSALFTTSSLLSNDSGILAQINQAKRELSSIVKYQTEIGNIEERLNSIFIDLQDVSYEMERLDSRIENNPVLLQELQQRLDRIYFLEQKHQVDKIEDLLRKKDEINNKLLDISFLDEKIEKTQKELDEVLSELTVLSGTLTKERLTSIPRLEQAMKENLIALGMQEAIFQIRMESTENFTSYGQNKVGFYFSSNKGFAPEEIAKVASGGELSRLMLAIKSITSSVALLPTLILDEIDTGISGDIAGKVAQMLIQISQHHQLLVITHLPQIASKANLHYFVYKDSTAEITATNIRKLTENERVMEIAKMMSDSATVTQIACEAAKELLQNRVKH